MRGGRRESYLIDLEPDITAAVKVGARAGALGHVDSDGALGVSPLGPVGGDLGAGGDLTVELGSLAVVVAAHVCPGGAHDGVIAGVLALDGGLAATVVRRPAGQLLGVDP